MFYHQLVQQLNYQMRGLFYRDGLSLNGKKIGKNKA